MPKKFGGIVFLITALYQAAGHLAIVIEWCRNGQIKQWVGLEQAQIGMPLPALQWSDKGVLQEIKKHQTIGTMWKHCRRNFIKEQMSPAPFTRQ